MKVVVSDYDPQWVQNFQVLYDRIWPVVQDFAIAIEHVGSTSVPELAAKAIVDIDVIVPANEGVRLAVDRLAAIGYVHQGNLGVEGREAFRATLNQPAHNLYVCGADSAALHDHLVFRDYLRAHPETARAYAALKRVLAQQYPDNIDLYAQSKTNFVTGILETAGIPRSRIDHIRRENGL
jgi:GrpB-like predicted nucleotidyltransferase (UPF0157 family)